MSTGLDGFAQIHVHLYALAPDLSVAERIAQDLDAMSPGLFANAQTLARQLDDLQAQAIDSCLIGGQADEFAWLDQLIDVVAVRYVRNEPSDANAWSAWQEVKGPIPSQDLPGYFGRATLLQCEDFAVESGGDEIRTMVSTALKRSPCYDKCSCDLWVALPFGLLFEVDKHQTIWLLVSKPRDERAAEWMVADWLRLVTFLLKHRHYAKALRQATTTLDQVITTIIGQDVPDDFLPATASIALDESRDQCEIMMRNLVAAGHGFSNALEDTFLPLPLPEATGQPTFLLRIQHQQQRIQEAARKNLNLLQSRWPYLQRSISLVKPRVSGDFYWSHLEEVALCRYVDCTAAIIIDGLAAIREKRGEGFVDSDPRQIAKDIYDWLRNQHIVYEFEPVDPYRRVQRIRRHLETIKQGTCVDLSCLYAALLEGAYQRPVLIHYYSRKEQQAHTVVGLWTGGHTFSGDGAVCRKQIEFRQCVGKGHLIVVECMGFSKGVQDWQRMDLEFDSAADIGQKDALAKKFNFAIDLRVCREVYDIQPIQQDT